MILFKDFQQILNFIYVYDREITAITHSQPIKKKDCKQTKIFEIKIINKNNFYLGSLINTTLDFEI